ncbi:DoxX family protein [Candidatus Nitrosotenuis cloacae]|uniref:DoxX family protein n=1 Tax=Candidatus Nitrosotenuis cloacae TaxID=1603555 RepID=UPI002680C136|nr:DoxX family protein [Candidatus Nitrosotenuis cloacae]
MEAKIREGILHDIVHFGLRIVIGVAFIVHGFEKFDPVFAGYMPSFGIPTEMAPLIALAEIIPGTLIIVGVLSRIASSLLATIMMGAIFVVLKASSYTGQMGYEYPLILLAANLMVIVIGPGRISLSHIIKKIPRVLQ